MSDKYENALRKLVKDEVISSHAVKRITGLDLEELSEDMKKAAGLLHTMLCNKCGGSCQFILEEQFDDCWEKADHKVWLQEAKDLATNLALISDEDLLFAVTRAVSGMQSVSSFSKKALCILMLFLKAHLRQAQKAATAQARKDDQAHGPEGESSDQGSG